MKSKATILIIFISVLFFSVPDFVSAQSSCPVPPPTLRRGSQGDCVRFLQQSLNNLIGSGLTVDGIFGSATEDAVVDYQQLNNLRVDGIVGTQTWNAISQELYGQPAQPQTQQQRQLPGYNLPPLPTGTGLTEGQIQGILVNFANFLIAAGVILAIITIVVSGIMYFMAGSDKEAKNAKGWFRNGITGAIVILAVGVIILTIYNIVVNRTFFGVSIPGGGIPTQQIPGGQVPAEQGPSGPTGTQNRGVGDRCVPDNNDCRQDLVCSSTTNICNRVNGNLNGESCQDVTDCLTGLTCGRSIGTAFLAKRCRTPSEISGQCQLTRILTDKTSVAAGEQIRLTVVAADAENCSGSNIGGSTINISVCQGTSCRIVNTGTFGTSTYTTTWSVSGIIQPIFYFKANIGSSSVRSSDIRFNQ